MAWLGLLIKVPVLGIGGMKLVGVRGMYLQRLSVNFTNEMTVLQVESRSFGSWRNDATLGNTRPGRVSFSPLTYSVDTRQ